MNYSIGIRGASLRKKIRLVTFSNRYGNYINCKLCDYYEIFIYNDREVDCGSIFQVRRENMHVVKNSCLFSFKESSFKRI